MIRKTFTVISAWLIMLNSFAAPPPNDIYRAGAIPEVLLKDVNSVVRLDKTIAEIQGPEKAFLNYHEVVTVLNNKASRQLAFAITSDQHRVLEDVTINLYDADGNLVEKIGRKELGSRAHGSGLVEDGKIYFIQLATTKYPVTIEKKYSLRLRSTWQFPSFYFGAPFQSVENIRLQVKYPKNMDLKFKTFALNIHPKREEDNNNITLTWEGSSIPPILWEPASGSWAFRAPGVRLSLGKFSMDGFDGDGNSWKGLGLWYNKIVGNYNKLKPEYQAEIRNMTAHARDDREKVRILYKYLQDNFRYVSIQLGIGGFRPFPADFLHEKKYGDCKGLSNYMQACLDAVGIRSYCAWVRSGEDEIYMDTSFTSFVFDHQILMVPLKNDSIWLECTSNTKQFGHLGAFTENRTVVLLTENGGKLAMTPPSRADLNRWEARNEVSIRSDGGASLRTSIEAEGSYRYLLQHLALQSADEAKAYLVHQMGFSQGDRMELGFPQPGEQDYKVTLEVDTRKMHDFKAGTKYFLRSRPYPILDLKLPDTSSRKLDLLLGTDPFIRTDTTVFLLPAGWTVESLPRNSSAGFRWGSFEARYRVDSERHAVVVETKLTLTSCTIPASHYADAHKFFKTVTDDGNQKLVLRENS